MTLSEWLKEYFEDVDSRKVEKYLRSKDLSLNMLANKVGGHHCYSREHKQNGVLVLFVINFADNTQIDSQTFLNNNSFNKHLNFRELLDSKKFGLVPVFLKSEINHEINIEIAEQKLRYAISEYNCSPYVYFDKHNKVLQMH
jgi:hypothetical protein